MAESGTRTGLVYDVERTLPASPEQVFRAWTEPDEMPAWFAPDPAMATEVEVDLRVGGRYRIAMGEYIVSGTYEAIDRPNRLVFNWRWENADDATSTLVTVELSAAEGGGTNLRLRHERLPDEAQRTSHAEGWEACLARLEQHLAG